MIRLYVVECTVGKRQVLYVGSTAKPLATRLLEHARGKSYCPTCLVRQTLPDHHERVRLRPDLLPHARTFRTRAAAVKAEKKLAISLLYRGYRNVLGGH